MEKYILTETERSIMEKSRIPFAMYQFINKRVVTIVLSDGFCDLFGYDDRELAYYDMDYNMYKDTHPDDAARIADAAYYFATEDEKYDEVYRSKNKEGTGYNIIHAIGEHVYMENGVRLAQVWYTYEGECMAERDEDVQELITALRQSLQDESLKKTGYYDYLTGLPNMAYFFELATVAKNTMIRQGKSSALLFTDLSGMKYYNRKHGFAQGDRLLQSFARALAQRFGNENCGRLGQDRFAVIVEDEGIEESLHQFFVECLGLNGGLSLPVHVGIYQQQLEDVGISTACDRAKLACDSFRKMYSSGFQYYDTSMMDAEEKRQYIVANLDRAMQERWIQVYYQPIVRAVNGRVCDEEALARWIDPVKGFLSPADFIPILEDSHLIYKLDLYMVDLVLEKLQMQKDMGLIIVPQSINLSRSDFDACDIVEEIRSRVDAAGMERGLFTIEITESIVGRDFDFMKEQVERFHKLGFPVWMDDFGSGYSSLDVLQSIHFDLIKFDMHFMRMFGEGDSAKIILTELMKMAASLGVDTVCEGVETEEQVRFLREIGCSKIQGYYYGRPTPVDKLLELYEEGVLLSFEDPKEEVYYETVGRVNLHDLAVIAQEQGAEFQSVFDALPMAIIELKDGKTRFARSNQPYRDFMKRYFGFEVLSDKPMEYADTENREGVIFVRALERFYEEDGRAFIDEVLPDRSTAHCFVRRIAKNSIDGTIAVAVAVLSITDASKGATYAGIARALAADYFNLYYVDLETEQFIEYSSSVGEEKLALERHGSNFFGEVIKDAKKRLYEEDVEVFVNAFTKENVIRGLDEQGAFVKTCRLMREGEPVYVNLKATRMPQDEKHIIIGINNIDAQMKQREMLEKIRQDQIVSRRMMALSEDYICLYTVNLETERYMEYSATDVYSGLGIEKSGERFFASSRENAMRVLAPEDRQRYGRLFTRENVLREIEQNGVFLIRYHLVLGGEPKPVVLRAAVVKESDGDKLIVGVFGEGGIF